MCHGHLHVSVPHAHLQRQIIVNSVPCDAHRSVDIPHAQVVGAVGLVGVGQVGQDLALISDISIFGTGMFTTIF